jgi:uncharacterized protein (DUF58 family)
VTVLTRSGLGVLVVAIVLAVAGIGWGYEELVIAAAGAGAAVLLAIWVAQRPFRATVSRRLAAPRVARGDPVRVVLRVVNDTAFRSGAATLIDRCDGVTVEEPVAPVPPRTAVELHTGIPTRRRGVFEVGPTVVERVDPFGLAVGRRVEAGTSTVIVHPRIHDLAGSSGAMHTVEREAMVRRIATDPLSGFVSLREYVDGDDPRLIHWPTTARTGTLMVREHVEVRRPEFTVVVDTAAEVATHDDFEEIVDVAASVAVHALRTGLDVVVRTTDSEHPGVPVPLVDEGPVLDLLTPVGQTRGPATTNVAGLFTAGLDHSSVVVVTGPAGPSSRLASSGRMMTVRIGAGAQVGPGVALAAVDGYDFAARWRPWA